MVTKDFFFFFWNFKYKSIPASIFHYFVIFIFNFYFNNNLNFELGCFI